MCTARCRWAPASFCISALLLAPAVGFAGGEKAPPEAAALEALLARESAIYLLLDTSRQVLEVKARGIVLDAVPIAGFALQGYRPARPSAPAPPVDLPALFTVEEDPEAAHRRLVAPTQLVPYSEEAEEAEEAAPPPAGALEEAPLPTPPGAYRVRLEGGWALEVDAAVPATGVASRLAQALRHGWARLTRRPLETPALVALALAPEDGQRLHHLFRRGTRILLAGGAAAGQA